MNNHRDWLATAFESLKQRPSDRHVATRRGISAVELAGGASNNVGSASLWWRGRRAGGRLAYPVRGGPGGFASLGSLVRKMAGPGTARPPARLSETDRLGWFVGSSRAGLK